MLAYKDFDLERTVTTGTLIKTVAVVPVPLDEALMEANAWIEEERQHIQIVSVETIQAATTPDVLRVWYLRRQLG